MKKVLLTGGGSGGHIYPLLAVAETLKKKTGDEIEVFYLGPKHPLNEEFEKIDVKVYHLASSKLRRYFSFKNFLDIPKFVYSFFQALARLYFLMPDIVFSKGGPGAFAVVLAARFYFIPIIIHESDSIPGLTNRLSSLFAKWIGISFEESADFFPASKIALVGNPIRPEFLNGWFESQTAKEKLKFNPKEPLILILGGSQGAQKINNFVFDNLNELLKTTQIYHQTGIANFEEARKIAASSGSRYQTAGLLNVQNLKLVFNAADLVISRAGAGAIFEIAVFGKPSILIPLEGSANNHQKTNAYEYAKNKAAIVIEETNFKISILLVQIQKILNDENMIKQMSKAAEKFSKLNAAEMITKEILALADKK